MKRSPIKRKTQLARGPGPARRSRVKPVNRARKAARRLEAHGTKARTAWWNQQPCACAGEHPACSGGYSDPSHVTSVGAGGRLEHIIAQSRGCHRFIHAHGWARWELDLGRARGWALELATSMASKGPDAPRGGA